MITKMLLNSSTPNYTSIHSKVCNGVSLDAANQNIVQLPDYQPTPLEYIDRLAGSLDVASFAYKYEGERFGGASFKPLGVSHAVIEVAKRVVGQKVGMEIKTVDILSGHYSEIIGTLTFTCATSGNHGYALAWISQSIGAKCRIYSPDDMSQVRKERITLLGAEVISVAGSFDRAVEQCSQESEKDGYIVISNLVQPGFEDIPELILNGYAVLARELSQQALLPITHIFVGGGGGRLAASLTAYFALRGEKDAPRIIVVEPEGSDCIFNSLRTGERASSSTVADSIMTGLVVARPSEIAWPILRDNVFASLLISDELAVKTLIEIETGALKGVILPIGETGVAALAASLEAARDPELRKELEIDAMSNIVAIACEGVTDPALLRNLTHA
jgi:diaminopropionate ammonia-lyase